MLMSLRTLLPAKHGAQASNKWQLQLTAWMSGPIERIAMKQCQIELWPLGKD